MGGDIYLYESVGFVAATRQRFGFTVIIHELFNPKTKAHNVALMRVNWTIFKSYMFY